LGDSRTRFRVRETTVTDPNWDLDRAIDLWQRMLSKRLRDLASPPAENQHNDIE
jgi:hypothetical protein